MSNSAVSVKAQNGHSLRVFTSSTLHLTMMTLLAGLSDNRRKGGQEQRISIYQKRWGPDQGSSSRSGGSWPRFEKYKAQAFETSLCGGEGKGQQEGKSEIVGSNVSPPAMASG